jgi:hypothetical protein
MYCIEILARLIIPTCYFHGSFDGTVANSDYMAQNHRIINQLEIMLKEAVVA